MGVGMVVAGALSIAGAVLVARVLPRARAERVNIRGAETA